MKYEVTIRYLVEAPSECDALKEVAYLNGSRRPSLGYKPNAISSGTKVRQLPDIVGQDVRWASPTYKQMS